VAATLERSDWTVIRSARNSSDTDAVALDLTHVHDFANLTGLPDINAIVHLAAQVDLETTSLAKLFAANVASVGMLASLARMWDAQLVLASTVLVGNVYGRIAESQGNAYARSKAIAELLVGASGVDSSILRFPGIYGWNGPTHLGLNRAIKAAAVGKVPTIVGNGRARRNYIYVLDAAAQIAYALEQRVLGTHVVAGTEALSIREMFDAVCETFLPGRYAIAVHGPEAVDQLFTPSPAFPPTRSLKTALTDIKAELQ
jgi:UDP-glucose 4-epimerase